MLKLKERADDKDSIVTALEQIVWDMEIRLDDLEQQQRPVSIRVFGVPGNNSGYMDMKVLALCNSQEGMPRHW